MDSRYIRPCYGNSDGTDPFTSTIPGERYARHPAQDFVPGSTAHMWPGMYPAGYGWQVCQYDSPTNSNTPSYPQSAVESEADVTDKEAVKDWLAKTAEAGRVDADDQRQTKKGTDDDGVGCMLHDFGEDCFFCGVVTEEVKPAKFGGKIETSASPLKVEPARFLPDYGSNVFDNWIPRLGVAPPVPGTQASSDAVDSAVGMRGRSHSPQRPNAESDSAVGIQECCFMCYRDLTKMTGVDLPGHCVECRARWPDRYWEEKSEAAVKIEGSETKDSQSRYDWRSLGYP